MNRSRTIRPMSATETAEQAALRAKYREERDKRVRPDGNEQYLEPTGRFANFLDDPYVPSVEREPLFDEVTVAFIGGGFSGLVTGARLKQAGILNADWARRDPDLACLHQDEGFLALVGA